PARAAAGAGLGALRLPGRGGDAAPAHQRGGDPPVPGPRHPAGRRRGRAGLGPHRLTDRQTATDAPRQSPWPVIAHLPPPRPPPPPPPGPARRPGPGRPAPSGGPGWWGPRRPGSRPTTPPTPPWAGTPSGRAGRRTSGGFLGATPPPMNTPPVASSFSARFP